MTGPGEYIPDASAGITRVEDLPKPRIERRHRNGPVRSCPRRRHRAGRDAVGYRTLHDLGDARAGRPVDLVVSFSRHRCARWRCCCLALDMQRQQRAPERQQTVTSLHRASSKLTGLH